MTSSELLPIYEMLLKSNEPLSSSTKVVRLDRGDSAVIRCGIADSGYEPDTLFLSRNHKNVTNDSNDSNSVSYQLSNYATANGTINFDCSAKRRNGKYQLRSLRIAPKLKVRVPPNVEECEINHCKNGGLCVTERGLGAPYCICVDNFTGKSCERLEGVLTDGLRTETACAYFGAFVLFFFVVVFGLLFFRERRKGTIRYMAGSVSHPERTNSACSDGTLNNYDLLDGRRRSVNVDFDPVYESGHSDMSTEKLAKRASQSNDLICGRYDNVRQEKMLNTHPPRSRLNAVSDSSEILTY